MKNTLKKMCPVIISIKPSLSFGISSSPTTGLVANALISTHSTPSSELWSYTDNENTLKTCIFSIHVKAINTFKIEA
ncbi:MAG: hypothetical protein ACKE51_09890 [Methylococcaceae bacterium]